MNYSRFINTLYIIYLIKPLQGRQYIYSDMIQLASCYNNCIHIKLYLFLDNIIMHVYIVPEPGNPVLMCCTVLLSLTQTSFHPAHISTPKGAYNACCHYRRKALLKHIPIISCQVLIFMGE